MSQWWSDSRSRCHGQFVFGLGSDHKENNGIDHNKWQYVKEKDLQQIRIQRIGPLVHGTSGACCLIHKNNLLLITHSIAENETSYKFIFKIPEWYDMINLNLT